MTSIEIYNQLHELKDQAAVATKEERVEDAIRIGGRIDELNDQLGIVLKDEQEMRDSGVTPVAVSKPKFQPRNVAQAFLGARDQFEQLGFGKVNVTDAIGTFPTPVTTDPSIPALQIEQTGFLSTIAQGVTDGDVKYMQASSYVNGAAQWHSGVKPESTYNWVQKTAPLATIAHWTPIPKMAVAHYGQLESVVNNELMVGLRNKEDGAALLDSDSEGITGVTKTDGVQTYTAKTGDTLYDSIRRMKTLSFSKSGLIPTNVCLSPTASEALDLLKDDSKKYLQLIINGVAWGLPITEDQNLTVTADTKTTEGILVYASNAATWFTSESDMVTMGLIDKQLVENTFTLLAEGEHALKVTFPTSFVYLAATIA